MTTTSSTTSAGPLSSSSTPLVEKLDICVQYLSSSDSKLVTKALNFLLARTADGFEGLSNAAVLASDYCPRIIIALGELLEVVNPLGGLLYRDLREEDIVNLTMNFSTPVLSYDLPSIAMDSEFKFLGHYLDDNPFLMGILMILRNMSFEAALESLIAYNSHILCHLVAILLWGCCHLIGPVPDSLHLSYDILLRVGGRLDFYGKRRVQHIQSVMEATPLEGSAVRVLRARINKAYAQDTLPLFLYATRLLLPILFNTISLKGRVKQRDLLGITTGSNMSIHSPPGRFLVLTALELLGRLVSNGDNHTFLPHCPAQLIETLVSYLHVNTYRSEIGMVAEGSAVLGDPYGRQRPPPAITLPRPKRPERFTMGSYHSVHYGAQNTMHSEYVDTELREAALEVLGVLCRLSPHNALPLLPRAVPLLLRLVQVQGQIEGTTIFSGTANRPEYMLKAHGLLVVLATLPESDGPLRAFKTELMVSASRDDLIADLILNKNHPAFDTLVDNTPPALSPPSYPSLPAAPIDINANPSLSADMIVI